jgi:hypothetical protein
MQPTLEKLLPIQPAIADLKRYLAARQLLPETTASLIGKVEAKLKKPRLSQADWKLAIKVIETALAQPTDDLALGLLISREYRRIPSACDATAEFHSSLDKLFTRFPEFRQKFDVVRALERAIEARSDGARQRTEFRAALDRVATLASEWPSGVFLKDYLALLRSLLIESDAAHGWDWTDPAWFARWNLPFPWSAPQHAGVDLTLDQCKQSDGWELHIRRILNTDGLTNPVDFPPAVSDAQKFFALYNSATGMLRLFVHYSASGAPGADCLVTKSYVSAGGAGNPFPNHGLFNNLGPICHTGEDIAAFENNAVVTYSSQVTLGWIVIDFPSAYYPLLDRRTTPYYLNTYVNAQNVAQLTLQGHFSVQVPIVTTKPTFFARVSKVFGAVTHLSDSAASVNRAGQKLQTLGNQMTAGGGNGSLLTALGGALLASAGPLGAAIGATQIVQSIIGLFTGGGGVKYSTYDGTVDLAGELRDEWFRSFSALLVADCPSAIAFDIPYYFKVHPGRSLGLFNLVNLPIVKLTCVHGPSHMITNGLLSHYFVRASVFGSLQDLIVVNPASGVTLESATVQVVLQKPWMSPQDEQRQYVLGTGVIAERDPMDGTLLNIFVPQFELPETYAERTLIAHGIAISPRYGVGHDSTVKSVLLRVHYVFRHGGQAQGQSSELILTYKCNPIWVGGVDNRLETTLPPLPSS